MKHVKQMLS